MIRKRIGLTEPPNPLLKAKAKPLEGAIAKEDVEELPDNIFTQPIKLNESKYLSTLCVSLETLIL